MTREELYTAVSRGRTANHLYLPVGDDGDPQRIVQGGAGEPTAAEILGRIISRTSLPVSATTIRAQQQRAADSAAKIRTWERDLPYQPTHPDRTPEPPTW